MSATRALIDVAPTKTALTVPPETDAIVMSAEDHVFPPAESLMAVILGAIENRPSIEST
jgi:hypothetical protein